MIPAALAALALTGAAAPVMPKPPALKPLHLVAHYRDASGKSHKLELWRNAYHVVRVTDDRLMLDVSGDRAGPRFALADPKREVLFRGSLDGLARLGILADWRALTTLADLAVDRPAEARAAVVALKPGKCRWMEGENTARICWSEAWGVALRVEGPGPAHGEQLEVEKVEALGSVPALPRGLHVLDLDEDMGTDID